MEEAFCAAVTCVPSACLRRALPPCAELLRVPTAGRMVSLLLSQAVVVSESGGSAPSDRVRVQVFLPYVLPSLTAIATSESGCPHLAFVLSCLCSATAALPCSSARKIYLQLSHPSFLVCSSHCSGPLKRRSAAAAHRKNASYSLALALNVS